jgi:amidophosphoribosyltransferase
MAGIFGVVSRKDCIRDALSGVFYLQNRSEEYCGLAWKTPEGKLKNSTHKGLVKENFSDSGDWMNGSSAIACVSGGREPVSELSRRGGMILCVDGNLFNYFEVKNNLLKAGASFSGYHNPEEISDAVLISKVISKEFNFENGVESLLEQMKGDFALVALTPEGIYAARGWGRKPLILGKKDGSYAVSSESVSFINTGFEIVRDVKPGEVVLLNSDGINFVAQFNLQNVKYGSFEWVYTAHPASIIDGKRVLRRVLLRSSIKWRMRS